MTRSNSLICLITLALVCAGVQADPGKRLLGIPFGDKLVMGICPFNTDNAKLPCWIDAPFVYKATGAKLGKAYLPNPSGRPEWAVHVMFELMLDRQNKVQEIKVRTFNDSRQKIAESIGQRFGKPRDDQLRRSDIAFASWTSAEGHVEMRCHGECWIEFRTPAAQSAREAELREREKISAQRPKSP